MVLSGTGWNTQCRKALLLRYRVAAAEGVIMPLPERV